MSDAKTLTDSRGRHYGHPRDHFATTRGMYLAWAARRRQAIAQGSPDCGHEDALNHAVYMICDKLARAATDPMLVDNWDDVQGYSRTAKMVLGLEE